MTTRPKGYLMAVQVTEFSMRHPHEYSMPEVCRIPGVPSSTVKHYIYGAGIEHKFMTRSQAAKKRSSRKFDDQASIADGFNKLMALLAKIPPPNFSGMSNTQSRAVG